MPTSVFPYTPSFPVKHWITREFITNSYGDGYYQSITQESAFSRADGMGSVASHKGLNHFNISFNKALYGSGQLANNVWSFLLARLDANNEEFYFYNPTELATPDLTGVNTTGRYLVRLANPNEVLSRSYFKACLFSYEGIELVECRT
jgi:hypothetical protein